MMAFADGKLAWYVARSGGLVAWAVVTASIVWGLALSTRLVRRRGVPAWLSEMHRFLGTLAVVFTGVHVAGLVADTYVSFGWAEVLVPFGSSWRPVAVAWGVVALYLLAAVQCTSWLQRWLPRRVWHAVHLASLALFVTATVHGFAAGADAHSLIVQWACLTGSVLVVFLGLFRLLGPRRARRGASRRPATATPSVPAPATSSA